VRARHYECMAGCRGFEGKECDPRRSLTDNFNVSFLSPSDRAEGAVRVGIRASHLPAALAAFSIQLPTLW
jgi:hypothetical protein